MKRILLSLFIIFAIGAGAFGATQAFFSDTETSTGNILAAGAIDLKIDNTSYYNHATSSATSWDLRDLTIEKFFDFTDIKPGDEGEDTISVHVNNNDAWACMDLAFTKNDDVNCTEPENIDDPDCSEPDLDFADGDLGGALNLVFWTDDSDNVLEDNEQIIASGSAQEVLNRSIVLADATENNVGGADGAPLTGGQTYSVGKAWCFGNLTQNPIPAGEGVDPTVASGITCDGSAVNNAAQSDALSGDVSFRAVQHRHNPTFTCSGSQPQATPTPQACFEKADLMLVLDRSGSINSGELTILKDAAKFFVDTLAPSADGTHVGEVSFSTTGTLDEHLTAIGQDVKDAIDALISGGFTNLQDAILDSSGELANPGDGHDRDDGTSPDYMVIITDGNPNRPGSEANAKAVAAAAADAARAAGTTVYVVGIGSDVDEAYLRDEIADDEAHYFAAADFDDLVAILADIASCP